MATIADYVVSEKLVYEEARKRAAKAAADAQGGVPPARGQLDTLIGERTTLQDAVADLRGQLAAGPPAADSEQLGLDLEAKLQELHAKELEIVGKQDELSGLEATSAVYADLAERARAAARQVDTLAEEATSLKRESDALGAAVAEEPVKSLVDEAKAQETTDKLDAARARLRGDANTPGDLPLEMFDRAEARWDAEDARIKAARARAATLQDELATEQGKAARRRLELERARAKLREFVGTARGRLDAATAALDRIAAVDPQTGGPVVAPLSPRTRGRLDGTLDQDASDVLDAATDAAPDEAKRDAKLPAVDTALAELDAKRLTKIRDDADRDPDTWPVVQNKKADVATARTTPEQGTYAGAHGALDVWEARVPEATWALVAQYVKASRTIDELSAENPPALKGALDTAEGAYVAQLQADGKGVRAGWTIGALAQVRAAGAAAIDSTADQRRLAALRGDVWEKAGEAP